MRGVLLTCVLAGACAVPGPPLPGSTGAPSPGASATSAAPVGEAVSGQDAGEAELRARREASLPGEELEALAVLVGEWELEVAALGEGGERAIGAGRASVAPILGGRFLEWRVETGVGGVLVRSRGLLGHDRERGVHELTWASESSSAQRIARGRGDARRGGLYLELAELDPADGGVRRSRTLLRIEDDDAFRLLQETWDPAAADWRALTVTRYRWRGGAGGG